MNLDPSTTKYLIRAKVRADGVIEKPDVVGAVFGQTEGLLGNELDMRDLQKSARIGRIEVEIDAKKGKSEGIILVPSSLDKVETAIIGAALESIDRVGPCKATITVEQIEDVRASRRGTVIKRAKELLTHIMEDTSADSANITDEVRAAVQVAELVHWGSERLPAGPGVAKSEDIILVEGRNDVLNLLRCGIKNALSVEGTNVPKSVIELTKERVTTIFIDGDRGGELIARELLQSAEVDFVARAPQTREVEEIPHKLVMKALNNRVPAEQYADSIGIQVKKREGTKKGTATMPPAFDEPAERPRRDEPREDRGGRRDDRERGRGREEPERGARREEPREDRGGRRDDRERGRGRERDDRPRREERREGGDEPRTPRQREERQPRGRDRRDEKRPPKQLTPELESYRNILDGISGSLKAVLLDKDGKEVMKDIAVRELAETLRNAKDDIGAVVFDGVVTQRLLDIADEKKIERVVGVKVGNVSKRPEAVQVITKSELE